MWTASCPLWAPRLDRKEKVKHQHSPALLPDSGGNVTRHPHSRCPDVPTMVNWVPSNFGPKSTLASLGTCVRRMATERKAANTVLKSDSKEREKRYYRIRFTPETLVVTNETKNNVGDPEKAALHTTEFSPLWNPRHVLWNSRTAWNAEFLSNCKAVLIS